MLTDHLPERPRRPISSKPAGYVTLATYSSLGRLWSLLTGAIRAGRTVEPVRGDTPDAARRKVSGYTIPGAAIFLDLDRVMRDLEDGFETHSALLGLLNGDASPLRQAVNESYALSVEFTVALTANRDLIVRPEFKFIPLPGMAPTLPSTVTLRARRLGKDEVNLLVQRACGLA